MSSVVNLHNINNNIHNIHPDTTQKMLFIFNSLEQGWTITKDNNTYIFTKKHNDKREVFTDNFLDNFIIENVKNHCD
jgi:hypothetical protein